MSLATATSNPPACRPPSPRSKPNLNYLAPSRVKPHTYTYDPPAARRAPILSTSRTPSPSRMPAQLLAALSLDQEGFGLAAAPQPRARLR
jgi:hypothetical protein